MKKLIALILITASLNAQASDKNIVSLSVGKFQYQQSGIKNYQTAAGETGSLGWDNHFNETSVQLNYLRNLGSNYVGVSIGNNNYIAASIGFGF